MRPLITPTPPPHLTPCQWQRAQGLLLIFLEDALVLATRYSRHSGTIVTPRILIDSLKAQAQLGVAGAPHLEGRLRAYTALLQDTGSDDDGNEEQQPMMVSDDEEEDVAAFLQRHVAAWPAWVPQDDVQRILQQTIDHMDACVQDLELLRERSAG